LLLAQAALAHLAPPTVAALLVELVIFAGLVWFLVLAGDSVFMAEMPITDVEVEVTLELAADKADKEEHRIHALAHV
jgi:hypothetical protein